MKVNDNDFGKSYVFPVNYQSYDRYTRKKRDLYRQYSPGMTFMISSKWVVTLVREVLVGCIDDLRRFSGISAISHLGSRR